MDKDTELGMLSVIITMIVLYLSIWLFNLEHKEDSENKTNLVRMSMFIPEKKLALRLKQK